MLMKIWLWGAGKYAVYAKQCIIDVKCIGGIFDSNAQLWGKEKEGISIFKPEKNIVKKDDILIITILRYKDVVARAKDLLSINEKQIVSFHSEGILKINWNGQLLCDKWKDIHRIVELENLNEELTLKLNNAVFELFDKINISSIKYPKIRSGEEALSLVISEHKSMCRFGDGEFEIILGRNRAFFQPVDKLLGIRLEEVLHNTQEKIITCIADNYGDLSKYTEEAATGIRRYLSQSVREEHMKLVGEKEYYDAYISRPYIMYKDKERAVKIFALWKLLWSKRDVLLVEGIYTRSGCLNDLFSTANSIKRILCPSENAWEVYDNILQVVEKWAAKDTLILIALGPTATVLAYDLELKGYQAIDMGHLDNEYEWYLRKCSEVEDIRYKYVNDYNAGRYATDINDKEYENQIIEKIGVE